MYEVGNFIICGSNGVCKVDSVGPIKMGNMNKEYYTLVPVYSKSSKIFTPVDNEKILMRPVLTKDEAEELINQIPEMDELWIPDEKKREEIYKDAMNSCECEQWVKIIKTLYFRKESRIAQGKKVTSSDERYLHLAEENLYGELAITFDLPKNEVEGFIAKKIEQTLA